MFAFAHANFPQRTDVVTFSFLPFATITDVQCTGQFVNSPSQGTMGSKHSESSTISKVSFHEGLPFI
jgi:hypothetical protein